jgi:RNA polymerase sigma factor (sigma-70 family)
MASERIRMPIQTRAAADSDYAEHDDASVIGRSRNEPEVFEIVFRRYADQIQRYVSRRIGADAADDVVAETFLLAFRQRDRYDLSRASARPWLYGIATNLIGRYRRTEVRHFHALARVGVDQVAESFTDRVDAAVSASAVNRRLAAALAALPAAYRDTLLLVAWGDLSHEEAAAALRVPAGTVRSRITRARSKLRRILGDADPSALHEENQA